MALVPALFAGRRRYELAIASAVIGAQLITPYLNPEDYAVLPRVRFNTTVNTARWKDDERHWVLDTSAGTYTANAVITAHGFLSEPAIPQTRRSIAEVEPEVIVHDILTLAPAIAGELEGVPSATLIPHIYQVGAPGLPPYAFGARLPRTAPGRGLWGGFDRLVQVGLRKGRAELNEVRASV